MMTSMLAVIAATRRRSAGSGGGGAVEINLAAAPSQADLDITVTDCDILEVYFFGVTQLQNTTAEGSISTDGSTYITTAASYTRMNNGTVVDDTHLEFLGGVTSVSLDVTGIYAHVSIVGFTAGIEMMYSGAVLSVTGSNTVNINGNVNGSTAAVQKVRIATIANLGTSGKIYYVKRSFAEQALSTTIDYSTDVSGVDGLDFLQRNRLYFITRDIAGPTRAMYRLGRNASIQSDFYGDGYYNASSASALINRTFVNTSLDNSSLKSLHGAWIDGLGQDRQAWNLPQEGGYGHCFGISNIDGAGGYIDGLFPHEWDDNTSHTGGTVDGLGVSFGQQDKTTVVTSGSQTEVIFDVEGYDDCSLVFAQITGSGFATADSVNVQVSTDGGVSYKSANYIYGQLLSGVTNGAASCQVLPGSTTGVIGMAMIRGLNANEMFSTCGIGGNTSAIRTCAGAYYGDVDAVTHIKLISPNGYAFNNGWEITCIKNIHDGTPPAPISPTPDILNHDLGYTLPEPLVWFSPRAVTLSGSNITGFTNQGSGGATYDASPVSNQAVLVSADSEWGGRDVINLATRNDVRYTFTAAAVKTVIGIASYGDGTVTAFVSYDSLFAGGGGMEVTGNQGTGSLYTGLPTRAIKEGVEIGNAQSVLPLRVKTIGSVSSSAINVSQLFADDFSPTTREWYGKVGDILMFTEELTAAQILAVCDALSEFYPINISAPSSITTLVTPADLTFTGGVLTAVGATIGSSFATIVGSPVEGAEGGWESVESTGANYVQINNTSPFNAAAPSGYHLMVAFRRNGVADTQNVFVGTSNSGQYMYVGQSGNFTPTASGIYVETYYRSGQTKAGTRDELWNQEFSDERLRYAGMRHVSTGFGLNLGRYTDPAWNFEGEIFGYAIFTDWNQAADVADYLLSQI